MNDEAFEYVPRALTARPVERAISPRDEMFEGDENHYFSVGTDALRLLRQSLAAVHAPEPRAILDLPCGHGRVLRQYRKVAKRIVWQAPSSRPSR